MKSCNIWNISKLDSTSAIAERYQTECEKVARTTYEHIKPRLPTKDDQKKFKALLGKGQRVATPLASAAAVNNFAREIVLDGFKQIKRSRPKAVIDFERHCLTIDDDPEGARDLREEKRTLNRALKPRFEHFLAAFKPTVHEGQIRIVADVIGVRADVPSKPRRRPKNLVEAEPLVCVTGVAGPLSTSAMVAEQWRMSGLPGLDYATDEPTTEQCRQEFEAQLVRACLRTDRLVFGYGIGQTIARNLCRQLSARAAGFDVCGQSILPPQAVVPFLADLCARAGGDLRLPAIRMLGS